MAKSKCAGCSHWSWVPYAQFSGDKAGKHFCDKFNTPYKRKYLCGGKFNDHKG